MSLYEDVVEPITKVLRMRSIKRLQREFSLRDNIMKMCTIGRKAAGKPGLCPCDTCKVFRREADRIKSRLGDLNVFS